MILQSNGAIEENIVLHSNGEVEEKALLHNTNGEDKEITSLHKSNGEFEENTLSENNNDIAEKDALLQNIVAEAVEKEKISSLECTNNTVQVEGLYSEAEDDHLQCWCDVSFFYTLIKSFTPVNCKDEYALLFYLQKYLHNLDKVIADLARQKSAKSALSDHKLPDVMKGDIQLNQKNNCSDLNHVERDHQDNSIAPSIENGEASSSPKENGSSCIDNGCFMQEKETKNETDENLENSNEMNIKLSYAATKDNTITENLQLEHEKISQLMQLFNSVEFDYPNPFDAVSLINGLCCDIVRKNPCNYVKKKFHDFVHEVNNWNAKFCVKDETVVCDICKEIINI